jgi:hypothetical protein
MDQPKLSRYKFQNIFSYDPLNGIIIPMFDVIVNGVIFKKGIALTKSSLLGRINLFNYIGRDIAGMWDPQKQVIIIQGFYQNGQP